MPDCGTAANGLRPGHRARWVRSRRQQAHRAWNSTTRCTVAASVMATIASSAKASAAGFAPVAASADQNGTIQNPGYRQDVVTMPAAGIRRQCVTTCTRLWRLLPETPALNSGSFRRQWRTLRGGLILKQRYDATRPSVVVQCRLRPLQHPAPGLTFVAPGTYAQARPTLWSGAPARPGSATTSWPATMPISARCWGWAFPTYHAMPSEESGPARQSPRREGQ